jgi:hypothetical protein
MLPSLVDYIRKHYIHEISGKVNVMKNAV